MPTRPTTPITRTRLGALGALVCMWSLLTYACTVEDENPGTPRSQRGTLKLAIQ